MGRFDALTQLDTKPIKSPLREKPEPTKLVDTSSLSPQPKQEASLPASMQTSKDANLQTDKPANLQAGKQVNLQTGKQVIIEKYSSYLPHEYKRELKRIAFESDRNEYEVLIEAVEHYLEKKQQA